MNVPASSPVDHVLLTRFNLPTKGYESLIRAREGWLRERLDLFEKYCLSSVRSQTTMPSGWIVYFDPESPTWLMDRIRAVNDDGIFSPVFRTEVSRSQLIADIDDALGRRSAYLLTTNVDNDDALASDFVARVRAVAPADGSVAIYLVNGLIRTASSTFLRSDADNAFCSVLASWADPRTCWSDWHNMLRYSMPVVRLEGGPAWLQVIHGSNVSNRVHGKLVSPAEYTDRFPGLLTDMNDPTFLQIAKDRLVFGPSRMTRDTIRTIGKLVVQSALGRDNIDKLKVWGTVQAKNMQLQAIRSRAVIRKK